MDKESADELFEDKRVHVLWDEEQEKWVFSVDVIEVLTGTDRPCKYWSALKFKLDSEGSQLCDKIGQLKMKPTDGKLYITDVADTEQLLRLIQSIPSPKAEPFKMWLAKAGNERIDETADAELVINVPLKHILKKAIQKNGLDKG